MGGSFELASPGASFFCSVNKSPPLSPARPPSPGRWDNDKTRVGRLEFCLNSLCPGGAAGEAAGRRRVGGRTHRPAKLSKQFSSGDVGCKRNSSRPTLACCCPAKVRSVDASLTKHSGRAARVANETRVARLEFVVAPTAAQFLKQKLGSADPNRNTNSRRPNLFVFELAAADRSFCLKLGRPVGPQQTCGGRLEFRLQLN